MKNKVFAELEKQVQAWQKEKKTKEQALHEAMDAAQKGLEEAEADSDRFMKTDDLKKYTEAESRKGFYNKRINHLTEQINGLEDGFLSSDQYQAFSDAVNEEQNRLLTIQQEKMKAAAEELQALVKETTDLIGERNTVLMAVNAGLYDEAHEEHFMVNTRNNRKGAAIAENLWYDLQIVDVVPVHFQNLRYSKFVAGVPFADE